MLFHDIFAQPGSPTDVGLAGAGDATGDAGAAAAAASAAGAGAGDSSAWRWGWKSGKERLNKTYADFLYI